MVDTNRRFKKRFSAIVNAARHQGIFSSLAKTGNSPEFVSQQSHYPPVLVHTVGFYPPAQNS